MPEFDGPCKYLGVVVSTRRVRGMALAPLWRAGGLFLLALGLPAPGSGNEPVRLTPKHRLDVSWVTGVTFSPDSTLVATGGRNQDLGGLTRLWDVATGREVLSLPGCYGSRGCLAFSPDGRVLYAPRNLFLPTDGMAFWDVTTGEQLGVFGARAGSVAISPDATLVLTANVTTGPQIWDPAASRLMGVLRGHTGYVHALTFARDGKRVATAGSDGTIRLWDTGRWELARTIRVHEVNGLPAHVSCVAFRPDGKVLASAGQDRMVRIWDAQTGNEIDSLQFPGQFREPLWLADSPDGRALAVIWSKPGTVYLYDAGTLKQVATLEGHREVANDVAFSYDGKALATSSDDGVVLLWDLTKLPGKAGLKQ